MKIHELARCVGQDLPRHGRDSRESRIRWELLEGHGGTFVIELVAVTVVVVVLVLVIAVNVAMLLFCRVRSAMQSGTT